MSVSQAQDRLLCRREFIFKRHSRVNFGASAVWAEVVARTSGSGQLS